MPLAWPPFVSDPWSDPTSWDTIWISGVPWGGPYTVGGKITVRGASRFFKWDPKEAKGQDGTNPTYLGTRPKPFKLIFQMWTSAQWDYWNNSVLPFFYYSGVIGKVWPLPLSHPATSICNISNIITEDIGQPEVDDDTKLLTQVIVVREYLPAAVGNASVTPVGPNPAVGPPKPGRVPSPAVQAAQGEVGALEEQAANQPSSLPHM